MSDQNSASNRTAEAVLVLSTDRALSDKQEVRKHVAAIHTSGELGLVERKLVNVLLLNAYDQLTSARQHRIKVKMLMAMLGWTKSEDTVHLQKALLRIVSTPVEFNLMDDNPDSVKSKRWTATALLAQADLDDGYCVYEYSTRLAEELSDPDVYAIINVGIQRQFKSGYALTLYENCVRYRRTGSTGMMSLEKFRKLMGATASTYDDTRRLVELLLNKAVKEVNLVSDITVTPMFERAGRKIVGIKFSVEEKAQKTIFNENAQIIDQAKQSDTFKRLLKHGIGEKLAIAWVVTDEHRAKAALDMAEHKARHNLIKSTTAGYVRRLIEDTAIDLSQSAFEQELENERKQAAEEQAKKAVAVENDVKAKADRATLITKLIRELTAQEEATLVQAYIAGPGAAFSSSFDFATGKFKKPTEKVGYTAWLREQIALKNEL
jgi:hypothetical protein